jgi:preprotein translocase subunit SecD
LWEEGSREAPPYPDSARKEYDMKKILVLAIVVALTGCATTRDQKTSVLLEFRPGSQSPGPGLTKMTVVGSEQTVYISKDVVLGNADVSSSRVVSGVNGRLRIKITFTTTGAERFAAATENNVRKPLGILVDGKLISAPIVMEKITGRSAEISGSFTQEEAKRIADGIVGN